MVACQHKLKKQKSWLHCHQIFWQAHQKFYGTQVSSLHHFDSRLAVSKINSVKLQQNNFISPKALFNESYSKDSYINLYNLDEWTSSTQVFHLSNTFLSSGPVLLTFDTKVPENFDTQPLNYAIKMVFKISAFSLTNCF